MYNNIFVFKYKKILMLFFFITNILVIMYKYTFGIKKIKYIIDCIF